MKTLLTIILFLLVLILILLLILYLKQKKTNSDLYYRSGWIWNHVEGGDKELLTDLGNSIGQIKKKIGMDEQE